MISHLVSMLRVKWRMMRATVPLTSDQVDLRYCYDVLPDVSRSFAVVIMNLTDAPLRDSICIFYLVLRALDTIEDDMSVSVETKLKELPRFHTHLKEEGWTMQGVGEGRERDLLEHFDAVAREFRKLLPVYQEVISDICHKMANGMCEFLQREVVTKADYDLYCHYVAGLVGHGLTRLFACCGFEDPHLADDLTIANEMGLFLQKTNIIRDYFEDIREEPPRMFWPKEIWSKYTTELRLLKEADQSRAAVLCLNEMVTNAIAHIPAVLQYMSMLRDPSVFSFCGIPQVMAIATLSEVYNNKDTFQVKVKISKGAACYIMLHSNSLEESLTEFRRYCVVLLKKTEHAEGGAALKATMEEMLVKIDAKIKESRGSSVWQSWLQKHPYLGGNVLLAVLGRLSKWTKPQEHIQAA